MLERIEELNLERKAKIYRKCIETILSKNYVVGTSCVIDGISFSFDELIDVCYYVIPVYGNVIEQNKFYNKFGLSIKTVDEELENQLYVDRLKYIYNFRENNFSKREKLKEFASNMKIRITDIKSLAREYATSYLKITKKEYDWNIFKKSRNDINAKMSFGMLFDLLLNFDDNDEIIYLIDYSCVDVLMYTDGKIKSYIKENYDNASEEEKERIYCDLSKKIEIYKNNKIKKENMYIKELKENSLIGARELLLTYVGSKYSYASVREYCKENNVDVNSFFHKLEVIKRSDIEDDIVLYNLCREKMENDRKKGSSYNYSLARLISDYVINGIPYEDGKREFDLIDYYSLANVNLRNILVESRQFLSRADASKFSRIVSNNERFKKALLTSKNTVNPDIEFNCKKDENGFPIPGTGRKITDDEKMLIMNVFEDNNIPIHVFRVAIERIKKGIAVDDLLGNRINVERKGRRIVKKPQ